MPESRAFSKFPDQFQSIHTPVSQGGGEPPDCSKIKAPGPPSPKAAAHRPMVWGSRPRASAVAEAVQPWANSQMACQRSLSRGVGARISRRCKSLASICHCCRNLSISLTPITNPSPTPGQASLLPSQIYPIPLHVSPWLWFSPDCSLRHRLYPASQRTQSKESDNATTTTRSTPTLKPGDPVPALAGTTAMIHLHNPQETLTPHVAPPPKPNREMSTTTN